MKKICFLMLGLILMTPNVNALTEVAEGSWATYNEGELIDDALIDSGYKNRTVLENSLYTADASEENGREVGFTGIGYFGEGGVTYYFDKYEDNIKTHSSLIVGNPDENAPDLTLTEVTWDGDKSTWISEGAEVWAVNYNGTGEDVLVAYAYNKLALTRAEASSVELLQVEGAKIDFSYQSDAKNLYDTNIYFPDDFVYCTAIRLVDITESLKSLGGNGQNTHDGYDLDAIYGYKMLYIPVEGVEYQDETAISVGAHNIGCEDSWQKSVMKVNVSELENNNIILFDIIAGGHYKVGTGEVYLGVDGTVGVRYNFNESYNLIKVNDVKIGIYKNYNNMLKNNKLLGNGQLTSDEGVTLEDEYAYIRLHFDVEIPTYLIASLEYVENFDVVCEALDDNSTDCDKDDKEHNCGNKKDCDKKKCNKVCSNHKNDKDDVKDNCHKKNDSKKKNNNSNGFVKKTCNKVKKIVKKCIKR